MKSILQKNKECYFCGSNVWLEEHHIFGAANRSISEKYGLKVYLCHRHHNEPPDGVHFNRNTEIRLKQAAQKVFEDKYSHIEFMRLFGRNWRDDMPNIVQGKNEGRIKAYTEVLDLIYEHIEFNPEDYSVCELIAKKIKERGGIDD